MRNKEEEQDNTKPYCDELVNKVTVWRKKIRKEGNTIKLHISHHSVLKFNLILDEEIK